MASTIEKPREYTARHRFARITARKARLVADEIRGKDVNTALELLQFTPLRGSAFYLKVLRSAVANASLEGEVNVNRLMVSDARADDGPMLQGRLRWHAGPQGRAMPFRKVTSHLTVKVRETEEVERPKAKKKAKKAKQTKAKSESKAKSGKGKAESAAKGS
jgi:large subunit ribosomal protein L22